MPTPPKPPAHSEKTSPLSENFRAVAGGVKTPQSDGADGDHGKSGSIGGIVGLPEGYRFGMVGR